MLLNKGEPFIDLVTREPGLGLVAALLGEDYLISCVDAQIQHPGSGQMPLHTDQWWMPPPVTPGEPHAAAGDRRRGRGKGRDPSPAKRPISTAMVANVMWMVSDFTAENGATQLVPGSHLTGEEPDPSVPHPMKTVGAHGPAGTAFAFDGRLWHGAGANRTDQPRYGITTNFCAPQCRQLENYTRGMRPEVLASLAPSIRERLGFKAWSSYGHTGDPEAVFAAAGGEAMGALKA
jgi:ectoine hydroxylase-related dioxygenase (phytanoyl-CoA dioxygenase family)